VAHSKNDKKRGSEKKSPPKKDRKSSKPKGGRGKKTRDHKREYKSGTLPEITTLFISGQNEDGDLLARPEQWDSRKAPPHIVVIDSGRNPAATQGDRVLARTKKLRKHLYQALVIRVLPEEKNQSIAGVFVMTDDGGIIEPISRKIKESYFVAKADVNGAEHGELVSAETVPTASGMRMRCARITERLGSSESPRAASTIATQLHELPTLFTQAALEEADASEDPVPQDGRIDIRSIPLVTIDGEDARDFDDAVFAQKDGKGWHIIVAIADVAHYVKEGSALDKGALERGNSVYFPDRVIPMLPERLSNGLCSLRPDGDRYCLAVEVWIDETGQMKKYTFMRALMRSHARLTYTQVEAARNDKSHPLYKEVIEPLYSAYETLCIERDERGPLNLNLPEYQIQFDDEGNVSAITPRKSLESHKLIEAFMITANVAAADFLLDKNMPAIYRVHEEPAEEKIEELKTNLQMAGYSLHTGAGIKAKHFNRILAQVVDTPEAPLINTAILRSQMQAYYSPECAGHFGLSLRKYCHFTSPIRRYADLIVHRSLAAAIEGKKPAGKKGERSLEDISLHISDTERRAMLAERDASDRYKVAFMSAHVGSVFPGVIVSLNEYGLFVSLDDNGVTGFIPVRSLPGDFYNYDKKTASFKGRRTGTFFQLGQPLIIRVEAANAITGSLIFELAQEPTQPDKPLKPRRGKPSKNNKKQYGKKKKKRN
jgi:ribonuclease R